MPLLQQKGCPHWRTFRHCSSLRCPALCGAYPSFLLAGCLLPFGAVPWLVFAQDQEAGHQGPCVSSTHSVYYKFANVIFRHHFRENILQSYFDNTAVLNILYMLTCRTGVVLLLPWRDRFAFMAWHWQRELCQAGQICFHRCWAEPHTAQLLSKQYMSVGLDIGEKESRSWKSWFSKSSKACSGCHTKIKWFRNLLHLQTPMGTIMKLPYNNKSRNCLKPTRLLSRNFAFMCAEDLMSSTLLFKSCFLG